MMTSFVYTCFHLSLIHICNPADSATVGTASNAESTAGGTESSAAESSASSEASGPKGGSAIFGILKFVLVLVTVSYTHLDSFIILDEAQNTTCEQMKMFLTRLGFNSKMVITGDITQIDLPDGRRSVSYTHLDVYKRQTTLRFVFPERPARQ